MHRRFAVRKLLRGGAALILAGAATLSARAQDAPAPPAGEVPAETLSLMGRLPENTLIVVTSDLGEDNPSIKFAHARTDSSEEDRKALDTMRRDVREGFSRMLRLFGQNVELYENLSNALGPRSLLAVTPGPKADGPPNFLLLTAVRDQAQAEARIRQFVTSVARNAVETVDTQGGARLHTWSGFFGSKANLSYLVGEDVAAVSSDSGLLRSALAAGTGTAPAWLRTLTATAPRGLLNAYVSPDVTKLVPSMPRQGDGPDAKEIGFGGQVIALGLTENGLLLTESTYLGKEGLLPLAVGGASKIPALSEGVFTRFPQDSLFAVAASSPAQWLKSLGGLSLLAPMMMGEEEGGKPTFTGMIASMFDGDVAIGLRSLLPVPSGLVTIRSDSPENAEKKLASVLDLAGKMKLKSSVPPFPDGRKVTSLDVGKEPFPHLLLEAQGDTLVGSSDRQTLEEANAINAGTGSLAESGVFQDVRRNLGDNPRLLMYADLSALSGAGMILSNAYFPATPIGRRLASSFGMVRGMGMGVEFDKDRLTARVFFSGDPTTILPALAGGSAGILPVAAGFAVPAIMKARDRARSSACESQMKQLATAAIMYAQDHDEHYPKANAWEEALKPYLTGTDLLHCPGDPNPGTSYAMNMKLSGLSMARVEDPANTVLFYESSSQGRNGHGVGEDVAWWHGGQTVVAYADAHVKRVSEAPQIEDFRLEKGTHERPVMTAPGPSGPSTGDKAKAKKK